MSPDQKANNLGLMKARAMRRYFHEAAPKPPKLRKRKRPHQSRTRVAAAIKDSRGNWAVLAERLECGVTAIRSFLERPENETLLQAFQDERLKALDRCVENVFDIANFCPDHNARLRANAFILQKAHPEFQKSNRITVEGGDKPIQVQSVQLQIPAEVMKMSVEDRLKVLEMADIKEQELALDPDDE